MRRRQALRLFAEVPFAEDRRGVACLLEQFAHRECALVDPVAAGSDDQRQAGTDRVLPRHQRCAAWRTGGLDQELGQSKSFTGKLVDAWRRSAAQLTPTVGPEVAVADVIR